jgi:MFS family permease
MTRLAVYPEGGPLPIGHRPLVTVLAANTISIAGDSVTQLGVPWYVLESTGSAARAGVVAFCALAPVAISAWASGPFIDRAGRRRVSILSDLACGTSVAAIPLLQIGGILHFWMLCALMALAGLAGAPGVTARGVLLPALAEHAGMPLVRAASLYDGAARCASMVGAALGGVLITTMGAGHVLLVDAATFGVSAVLIASGLRALPAAHALPPVPMAGKRRQGPLGESLGFLLGVPLLLGICLTSLAAQGLDQGWSSVLLPVDVRDKLGSVLDLGMLETVFALCALAGALLYGAVAHRWRRRTVFAAAFVVVGAPRFAVAALTGSVAPLAVMMAVEGLACGALNPIRATVVYETVPEHLRSRVVGVMTSAGLMAAPFGGLVAGFLVGAAGLSATLLVTGSVYLAVTLWPVVSASWREMDPAGE